VGHSAPEYTTVIISIVYLSEECDAAARSEVEYSQHIVRQSAAWIPAVGRRSQPTSKEMTRKPTAMQWCPADTFLTQTLVG